MPKRSKLSKVREAAGRAGAAKRWAAARRPTRLIRVYADDADRIAALSAAEEVSAAEIVTRLLSRA